MSAIAEQFKESPLLFKAPMVIATLEDRKTQTRRLRGLERINENPDFWSVTWQGVEETSGKWAVQFDGKRVFECVRCPYGAPGDRLWVRETWCCKMQDGEFVYTPDGKRQECYYQATETEEIIKDDGDGGTSYRSDGSQASPWVPSIFMPRWASRITLEIISVRVERLRDMSNEDAQAEGIQVSMDEHSVNLFADLWDSINGKKHPWASNPWVWVVSFRRLK